MAGAVREDALNLVQGMNARHAYLAFDNPTLSPYGLVFLFSASADPPSLQGASKLWLGADEALNEIPVVLNELTVSIRDLSTDPNWDLLDLANKTTDPIDRRAWRFVGLGLSSLFSSAGPWQKVRAQSRTGTEIPGTVFLALVDGTLIVCERAGLGTTATSGVLSTHPLDSMVFASSTVRARDFMDSPETGPIFRAMTALTRTCWMFDQAMTLGPRRERGRVP
jgi:hypothetical protein